jgi:hypothetical protein
MDSELTQVCNILSRASQPKPAQHERYAKGFCFDPRRGHQLALDADQAAHIEHAAKARVRLYAGTAITLGLSVQFESVTGDWSGAVNVAYSPVKDARRAATLPSNLESFLLPTQATQLDLVAIDESGVPITSKRCAIPVPLFRAISAMVDKARNLAFSPRAWQVEQQEALVQREMRGGATAHDVVVDLFDAN